jgi:hypothetical protein
MGSIISLGIGRLELDWAKNHLGRNHSVLFGRDDISLAPYYYADDLIEEKPAFVRPLRRIVRRLEMLGFTLYHCRRHYNDLLSVMYKHAEAPQITYEEYACALLSLDVNSLAPSIDETYDFEELRSEILRDPGFLKVLPQLSTIGRNECMFFRNLDPYFILRLLAENPTNLDMNVVWAFDDIVDGGSNMYQGELLSKEEYIRTFLTAMERRSEYDYTGLARLWDHLIGVCTNKPLVETDTAS